MIWVLLFTLGAWREYNAFIVFIDVWFYGSLICVTVDTFEARQKHKGPKAKTVLRIAMRTIPIPVTVGIFEARRQHEGPK